VAEYVRMSTDKQDTSVANQRTAIAAYASAHHMIVAQSYVDEGRSGLDLEGRPALQRLLDDVQKHCTGCTAILVLDVSRWGRFQNVDESAFYEFLCTQHGLRVIYVAEPFTGGEGPLHAVLKSLKRSMAAEYSRELSAKVFAGQARLVRAGFAMGGPAAYGLSRMLVDASGKPRCILKPGERKSIATDRVRLVLGPRDEVAVVRWMFKQAAAGVSMNDIARRLNQKGKRPARGGASWSASTIRGMLDDERYLGKLVFGRDPSRRLSQPDPSQPEPEPIRMDHAFPAIVTQELFDAAREQRELRSRRLTDDEMLEALRELWQREGRINFHLMATDPKTPTSQAYLHRFGSLRAAYKRIGYIQERDLDYGDIRDRIRVWLPSVMGCVREALEDDGSTVTQDGRTLRVDEIWSVSFHLMQSSQAGHGNIRWIVPRFRSTADILVGIRMDVRGERPLDYLILPAVSAKTWPDVIQNSPDAGARFYLFDSLRVLRELAALSMGVPDHACDG
jgi:DNA invertase Pin-like site-specific DNA recombinase